MSSDTRLVLQDLENAFRRQVQDHRRLKFTTNETDEAFHAACERAFSQAADMVADRMSRVGKEEQSA